MRRLRWVPATALNFGVLSDDFRRHWNGKVAHACTVGLVRHRDRQDRLQATYLTGDNADTRQASVFPAVSAGRPAREGSDDQDGSGRRCCRGCASGSAVGAGAPGLKPIDPAAFQASIEGLAKDLMLPGAMVLLSTPQGDIVFGYGTTELGAANPPRADTHFRAASNTKTMTAASIVQMVQEGKLSFDDPISKYVDGVPDGDKITISELLKMRSGLFNFTNAPELAEEPRRRSGQGMDRRRGPRHGVQAAARIRAGGRVRIQQHQLLPARARRREDRRQAARGRLPGPPVRAARHEEHGAAGARVERHPRALCTRLLYGGATLCAGRCALSGRSRGRGQGGHAQAGGRHLAEPVAPISPPAA